MVLMATLWIRRLLLTALIVIALAAGLLYVLSTKRLRFPTEGKLVLSPPVLRVPSADCYEAERYRVLLVVKDQTKMEARFNWNPSDGKGRVRWFDSKMRGLATPQPEMLDRFWLRLGLLPAFRIMSSAVIITARPDAPFPRIPPRRLIGIARVYLGGTGPDGEIAAIPFQAWPEACTELLRLGASVTLGDLAAGADTALELRITREGERVRYRWGPDPYSPWHEPEDRFSLGDVDFSPEEVAAGAEGPLIPALAGLLEIRGTRAAPKVVFLEAGSGVRYVDYLRAVECGGGHPKVLFLPFPLRRLTASQLKGLPRPPPGAARVLRESLDLDRSRSTLSVFSNGSGGYRAGGGPPRSTIIPALDKRRDRLDGIVFHANRSSPWIISVRYHRLAGEKGAEIYFAMSPLDPVLGILSIFHLPRAAHGKPLIEVVLVRHEGVLSAPTNSVFGKPVRVHVPLDAKMGETLDALIRLRLAGATGFAFE